ncbi:MAG: sensor histidine kinase [Mastigocoleus sp.]
MNTELSPKETEVNSRKDHVPIWASLKFTVPFILLAPLITCVTLLGTIAIFSGYKTAEKFEAQSMKTLNEQIKERLNNYLDKPHYINKINNDAIQQNQLNLKKINTLGKHFWLQAKVFKNVNGIQFGTEKNGLVRSIVREGEKLTFNVGYAVPKRENVIIEADSKGSRGRIIDRKENYDPRKRPWYKTALEAKKETWTKIFAKRTASEAQLRLSAVKPVYEKGSEKLLGVLAVDFFLTQISDFLKELSEDHSREIFIVDRSGRMIASSTHMSLFKDTGDAIDRVEAAKSNDTLVEDTARAITQQLNGFNQIKQVKSIKYNNSVSNEAYVAKIAPFNDKYGLDWLVVIMVPEKEFMQGVKNTMNTTILLGIGTLLFSLLLGIFVTTWLIKPILRLNNAAKQIEDDNIPFEPEKIENVSKRLDEIGQLAGMFKEMAEQIYMRERNLKDRVTQLRKETDKAKKAALATQITGGSIDIQELLTRSQDIRNRISSKKY